MQPKSDAQEMLDDRLRRQGREAFDRAIADAERELPPDEFERFKSTLRGSELYPDVAALGTFASALLMGIRVQQSRAVVIAPDDQPELEPEVPPFQVAEEPAPAHHRRCTACGHDRHVSRFYKKRASRSGYAAICKKCWAQRYGKNQMLRS